HFGPGNPDRMSKHSKFGWIALLGLIMLQLNACKPPLREAENLIQHKQYNKAERMLSQLVKQDPSTEAQARLAQVSFYTQGPEVAIEQLQALYAKGADDKTYQ